MPQMAPITLKNEVDNVDHVFKPRGIEGGVATFAEAGAVPLGDRTITFALNRTSTGRLKPSIRVKVPIVQNEVINGVARPAILRTGYADLSFTFDSGSTGVERAEVQVYAHKLLAFVAGAMGHELITSLETPY